MEEELRANWIFVKTVIVHTFSVPLLMSGLRHSATYNLETKLQPKAKIKGIPNIMLATLKPRKPKPLWPEIGKAFLRLFKPNQLSDQYCKIVRLLLQI